MDSVGHWDATDARPFIHPPGTLLVVDRCHGKECCIVRLLAAWIMVRVWEHAMHERMLFKLVVGIAQVQADLRGQVLLPKQFLGSDG